jgi:transposase
MTKRHFKPKFRQEVAELVLDKNYSVKEAATAMGVGNSTVDKWVRQLRKERNGLESKASPISPELRRIKELERKNQRLKRKKKS